MKNQRNKKKLTVISTFINHYMDLNNIDLPQNLVAELYPDVLVIPYDDSSHISANIDVPETSNKIENEWISFGNNEKNITLIVNYKDSKHLPDDELSFLSEILSACRLSIGDVAILNINNFKNISYKDVFEKLEPAIVILLGVDPGHIQLPVVFPEFQVQSFSKTSFLFSPPLQELRNDKILKSKLWVCLKQIFGI
ncbi:MAG TPA: hypothetical protein PKC72_08570 [Chitinophagaceae bacterium]|nr:hypothetical protein [Chitinophagaceae bacterium]